MRVEQIQGRVPKRFKQTTNSDHDDPIAANLLARDFTAAAPNQRWVSDTTEFVIGENAKVYLAPILDLFSRFVVGWAISAVNDRRLTLKALEMAVARRCPDPGLLHHSDRGCTYTCEDYQTYLAAQGITCSMSRRGDCYDHAVIESFFATVRKEELSGLRATGTRRWRCSTISRSSTISAAVIRLSARSVRPPSNDAHRRPDDDGGALGGSQVPTTDDDGVRHRASADVLRSSGENYETYRIAD